MNACIGWRAETSCTHHRGPFHGCGMPDGHAGDHLCRCGARARSGAKTGRRGRPYADEPSDRPRGHHWRGKAILI